MVALVRELDRCQFGESGVVVVDGVDMYMVGQTPQSPPGMCAMSRTKRPWV